ncbi:MAG: NAD(P)/FAD-dependent oxidoreductase [Dehalococcoidia bacterium]|nr:NAD(P)/FAD-dependent oxidoreductase [Dehalococcoidia bacterium]
MKQIKCDVAVIGSGLGGTTAASLLLKKGYNVQVVEKLPFYGGRCQTLDHHGFRLNTGAAMIGDSIHGALCREVGAELELRVPDPVFKFRIRGKDFTAPPKRMWQAIIGAAARDDAEADRVFSAWMKAITWAEPSYSMSMDEWARQHTDNALVLKLFHFLTCGIGVNSYELPAGEFFRQITQGATMTWAYPPRGCGQFSDALVGAIKRMGGDVWTRCPAIKINVKNGAATGVVVQKDGEQIEIVAKTVISNAPPRKTVELAGQEHFGPGYLKDVQNILGSPMICFEFASDKQLPQLEGSSCYCFTEYKRAFMILDFSSLCPEMSPKGKHLLEAACVPASVIPPYDIRREAALALEDLRQNMPGFDKDVKLIKIRVAQGDWGVTGNIPGRGNLSIKTPVYGLYAAGDRSAPEGWWCSLAAIKSGRLVAEDIAKRFKPA